MQPLFNTLSNTFISVLVCCFAVYCLFLGLVYMFQERLIFFPSAPITYTPDHIGLAFEEVRFYSKKGPSCHGWFVPHPEAKKTVLFCHGNAGNISDRLELISLFHRLKLNVFIFDYQGYGKSQGRPSETNTVFDALGAWDYLVDSRSIDPSSIVIFGKSLGGAVAVQLAHLKLPSHLILDSTFTRVVDMARRSFPFLPVAHLTHVHYDSLSLIPKLTCPILVIHSPDDELIPIEQGEALYQAITSPKRFFRGKGGHNDVHSATGALYDSEIGSFLGL